MIQALRSGILILIVPHDDGDDLGLQSETQSSATDR